MPTRPKGRQRVECHSLNARRVVLIQPDKVKDSARCPDLLFIASFIDRIHRVSLRIITMPIQSQGIITKDNQG